MREVTRRQFLVASGTASLALWGCGPRQLNTPYAPMLDVSGPASLRVHAADARLLFGFAVDTRLLRENQSYRRTVKEQCSLVVAENAMKWHALRPAPGTFSFDDADTLLKFCEDSRIKLRGHNLCWHEALPTWFDSVATAENARRLLTEHIRTVAGRYAGRMHSWDVVNEAINIRDGRADGLRNSPWLRLVGTDYIETAFRTARDADPAALLSYNEYGIEDETHEAAEKRAATLLLLRRLKQRNVPIDAVGIQSHLKAHALYGYGNGLRQFIEACRSMELEVFLSEMDVNDRDLPANVGERDLEVAEVYRSYLRTALEQPSVTAVLTWGVDDRQTWLNSGESARADHEPQRPLLFDSELRAKPAFAAVREAFDGRHGGRPSKSSSSEQPARRLR